MIRVLKAVKCCKYLYVYELVVMSPSWILASRAEPSWKFSELSRAELASFEIRAESELDFFFRKATFPKNVFIQMILFKHIVHTKP